MILPLPLRYSHAVKSEYGHEDADSENRAIVLATAIPPLTTNGSEKVYR